MAERTQTELRKATLQTQVRHKTANDKYKAAVRNAQIAAAKPTPQQQRYTKDLTTYDANIKMTGFSAPGTTENVRFTRSMEAINAVLPSGTTGTAYSQSFNTATHSSSIVIFDSLGSKHTLRMEFRKTALDTSTGSTWSMLVSVPEPVAKNQDQPSVPPNPASLFRCPGRKRCCYLAGNFQIHHRPAASACLSTAIRLQANSNVAVVSAD